ncbi:polyprenyl synthetase family protein [Nocardia sp. KC 131]|uniref:polyprenyl synthetase family protein n=1 Tax=Nocardia arseniciresistens TaxID=3392119 RepID=UPI00398EE887
MSVTTTEPLGTELTAHEVLASAGAMVEPALRVSVDSLGEPLRRMAGYHLGWWDATGMPVPGESGKALRAALAFSAAAACGGNRDDAVPAAAAVELLHNFSLVHDDVMDADPLRCGRRTTWNVWGINNAILLGDALQAQAVKMLSTRLPGHLIAEAITRLQTATLELCRGQYADCAFENQARVGIDDYLSMVAAKVGSLMACAGALGALCAGAHPRTVSAMEIYGRELGSAFKFVDDVIGIYGDPAFSDQCVGNDLRNRKKTLPVIAALESGTDAGVELADLFESIEPLAPEQVARAAALVEQAGGLELTLRHVRERLAAATAVLPVDADTRDLEQLARLVTVRDN